MSENQRNLDSLFDAASEIESAEERAAFLDSSCGSDHQLRLRVEQLLDSAEQAGSFLEKAVTLGNREVAGAPAQDTSEAEKEAHAVRQANAAVMLLRMDAAENVWPLLKHSSDPRTRSYIIHWLSPRGGSADAILDRYEQENDVTIRRALLLCLGEFDESGLPEHQRKPLIETLLTVYRSDPDAGLHASAEWLLRRWGQAERIVAIDKGLRQKEEQLGC